jgi:hypothetical protein
MMSATTDAEPLAGRVSVPCTDPVMENKVAASVLCARISAVANIKKNTARRRDFIVIRPVVCS